MHNASRSKTFFFILNFIRIGDQDVNLTVKLIIKYMVSFVLTSSLIFSLQLFGSSGDIMRAVVSGCYTFLKGILNTRLVPIPG